MSENKYFEHFNTLPLELRNLINEYGGEAETTWKARSVSWRTDAENAKHVKFILENKRKFIQNYTINETLGTCNW